MKRILLLVLIFASITVSAKRFVPSGNCKALFSYSAVPQSISFVPTSGATFNFFDISDGEVISWNWDFGDGETSYEQSPSHTYTYPVRPDRSMMKVNPYRTVTLSILTADSCSATYSETINIYDIPVDGGETCKSDFYFYQTGFDSLAQTATFKFINMSGAESPSYFWNFSDGLSSYEAEPEMTFDFSRTERKVCLTVTGADSCSNELCQTVYIDPKGGGFVPGDTTSNACFVAFGYTINQTVNTFAPALVLDFYAKTDNNVAKYLWDFGDGTSSDEANPTHTFEFPTVEDSILGDPNPFRTICLTITTVDGCESSWCEVINIYTGTYPEDNCTAWFKFQMADDVMTIPEVVPYRFYSTNEAAVSWLWEFEDGTTSTDKEITVSFNAFKQSERVCLTTTNNEGCVSTWCETVFLSPIIIDTIYPQPDCSRYKFRYDSYYPEWASACVGTVTAQVVNGDSLVGTQYYYWTSEYSGEFVDGPLMKNMCPTETYTVTALTNDGCKFSASVVFNSDGTVTEVDIDPINWWIIGWGDDSYIECEIPDSTYIVEWILCDGTVYSGTNVPLQDINCGSNEPNLFLKDAEGNVVYSEKIALRVGNPSTSNGTKIRLFPNPVDDLLNISIGTIDHSIGNIEITDLKGKSIMRENQISLKPGQQISIDVSGLQRGVYITRIISDNKIIASEKFVK